MGQDVRKEINFCQKVGLPIIGIVENMSQFVCPKCKFVSSILPTSTGGVDKLSSDTGVPVLARIPLDPVIGKSCDNGVNMFSEDELKDSKVVEAYSNLVEKIQKV